MKNNFFKTAFRFLWWQKTYSFINIMGLAVGLACSFFILLWVQDERGYDRFHKYGDRLCRAMVSFTVSDGSVTTVNFMPKPLAETLEKEYPEVAKVVLTTWEDERVLSREEQAFRTKGFYADSGFFNIFSFPLLQGDSQAVLAEPQTVVISESLARKCFGPTWEKSGVVGQTLRFDNRQELTVSGVFADVPSNSSLQFDFVLPSVDFFAQGGEYTWDNFTFSVYVLLHEGANAEVVSEKIKNLIREHYPAEKTALFLQPVGDMHLYTRFENGRVVGGQIEYVRIFSVVALVVLLIAAINFMNLATARSAHRMREVGVRKAIGARQPMLIARFLGESMLTTLLAFGVAMALVTIGLPVFNALTGKQETLASLDAGTLLMFPGIALLTGLLAGSYPAIYLSSFNAIGVLRGSFQRARGSMLRKGLVVFQFAASILLAIMTITLYRQVDFIRSKNLGLDRDNLIYTKLEDDVRRQYDAFRQELLQQQGIVNVTTTSLNPLNVYNTTHLVNWTGKDPQSKINFSIVKSNYDFVETMKMEMVAGRPFSRSFGVSEGCYLINERAAKIMGMDDPVGQRLSLWGVEGRIEGVVKDFHNASMHKAIEPTIIWLIPDQTWMLFARAKTGHTKEALASLDRVLKKFSPGKPFDFRFLDDEFEQMYRSETVAGQLAGILAVLAIFIACLGLLGLAAYAAEQRTKEIGIRKINGAKVFDVMAMLNKDFVKWVAIAFVIATPIAYFAMHKWLENFAYKTELSWWTFALAGLLALGIALLTVSWQSWRAATRNPVEALRYE